MDEAMEDRIWEILGGRPEDDSDPEVRELDDAVRVTLQYERDKFDDLSGQFVHDLQVLERKLDTAMRLLSIAADHLETVLSHGPGMTAREMVAHEEKEYDALRFVDEARTALTGLQPVRQGE